MKIRTDFVTNSSSSSYIIAYKSFPIVDEDTVSKYPWVGVMADKLFEFISKNRNEALIINDVNDLNDYILSEFGWGLSHNSHKTVEDVIEYEGEYLQNRYNQVIDALSNGFKVIVKDIPYSDHITEELILALTADKDNFRVLDDYES